jgi:hypothetical protein
VKDDALADPVVKLLELGVPKYAREFAWPDYRQFGIGPEHIPTLICIAVDHELINHEDETNPTSWGPVHAWRALGQLGAAQAIEPLISLFHEVCDNDWVIEEMPDVFALIGPAAFPALAAYLKNPSYPTYSRLVAATSLMEIARAHPEVRLPVVESLAEQLACFSQNSPGTNGVLIANLVELDAVEQVELIQKVFSEGKVDRFIAGDWRDIKKRLDPARRKNANLQAGLTKNIASAPPDPSQRSACQEPRTSPRH